MDSSVRHDEPPPRGLLLLAAAWVALSILVAFGPHPPLLPVAASYGPAVGASSIVLLAGILLAYPLLRLTLPPPRRPLRRALLDLAVLIGVIHAYVWPVRLATTWSLERTAAIDLLLCGCSVLAVAVAMGGSVARSGRTGWMVGWLVVVLGPVVAAPFVGTGGSSREWIEPFPLLDALEPLVPFAGIARLVGSTSTPLAPWEWRIAVVPAMVGVVALLAAAVATSHRGPSSRA